MYFKKHTNKNKILRIKSDTNVGFKIRGHLHFFDKFPLNFSVEMGKTTRNFVFGSDEYCEYL